MRRRLFWLIPLTLSTAGFAALRDGTSNHIHEQIGQEPSCSAPSPEDLDYCSSMENKILDTVVRLELATRDENGNWYAEISHGTVIHGRYLLTHNHFGSDLKLFESGTARDTALLALYMANGQEIQLDSTAVAFKLAADSSESLLLDFGTDGAGVGLLGSLGLSSAEYRAGSDLQIGPTAEVARVDWNGTETHVEWVVVADISNETGFDVLELSEGVLPGGSGGGVFWQGYHIGNNWKTVDVFDEAGALVHQYSKAALNPEAIGSALTVTASN